MNIQQMMILTFVLVAMLGYAPGALGTELCKWVDENGTVHYDIECPESVEADSVEVDTRDPEPQADDPYAASRDRLQERSAAPEPAASAPAEMDYSRMSASQLARECEKQREAILGPEREQQIAQCKAEGQKSASQCERFYADWGNGGSRGGHTIPRRYDNLPVCVAARGDSS